MNLILCTCLYRDGLGCVSSISLMSFFRMVDSLFILAKDLLQLIILGYEHK